MTLRSPQNYALFPVYPTTCDLARLKAGGDHWVHELQRDSWVGVMPRYGSVAEMRWFRGPKGVSCYHMMNAFEDAEGRIQLDQCLANVNAFPFIQRASGIDVAPGDSGARLARWTHQPAGRQRSRDGDSHRTARGPSSDSGRTTGTPLQPRLAADHEPRDAGPARRRRAGGGNVQCALAVGLHAVGRHRPSLCRPVTASTNRCTCRPAKRGTRGGC